MATLPLVHLLLLVCSGLADSEQNSADRPLQGGVILSRVHPVSGDNFINPDEHVNGPVGAGSLVETVSGYESRVPDYHVQRLRDVQELYRTEAGQSVLEVEDTPRRRHHHSNVLRKTQGGSGDVDFQLTTAEKPMHSDDPGEGVSKAIRMTNLRDSQYVGPLKVGSQGDVLSVVYDTGSTNLWFASTLCTEGSCLKRRRYDPKSSTTFTQGDYDLHVTFGTGELTGQQGIDDVEMAGFKVRQQTFSMIQKEEGLIFDELNFEGILGLAFPAMSANHVVPFFDNVLNQKLLSENIVSFFFTKLPTDASAVFFGAVDERLYTGRLHTVPVQEQYYWLVGLKEFKIGDEIIDGPNKVVFDTGTTYYAAPKTLLKSVIRHLPQTACQAIRDGTSGVPDMKFTILTEGGRELELVVKPHELYVSAGKDHMCDPAWMPIDVPSPHGPAWIFGEAFSRTFFTAFDRGDGVRPPAVKIARLNPDARKLVQKIPRDVALSTHQEEMMSGGVSHKKMKKADHAVLPVPSLAGHMAWTQLVMLFSMGLLLLVLSGVIFNRMCLVGREQKSLPMPPGA